ncbi:hypothetical protein [Yoonia sp.]|uniref:hypothetical protein n=1 Tax=Yoonia sp. TaxID=2212373 RepID=UPI002E01BCF4|nr:hypothetical protein [Yoonia sp.]
MAEKFEIRTTAERYIHNDLSNCAHWFQTTMNKKFEDGNLDGCGLDMMAALVFAAFSVEAKVNFVGFKVLENGWPERANLREKIDLLLRVLPLDFEWGNRPLQTIADLKRFRDTLAHGKPEIIDKTEISNVEPEVWDALKSQWEKRVSREFVNLCREDEKVLWKALLDAADIPIDKTLTIGGHDLTVIR